MTSTMDFSGFVLLDIETTGLDPRREVILEVGIVLLDTDFAEVDSASWLVGTPKTRQVVKNLTNKYVLEMHTENGLISDILESSGYTALDDIENSIVEWLYDKGAQNKPMCGSSIHFDRAFLKEHMPLVETTFHYRNIDVSTLMEISRTLNPDFLDKKIFGNLDNADSTHRALADCRRSGKMLQMFWLHGLG